MSLFWQGQIDVRSSRPLVKEDDVERDKRRQTAEKQKSAKDLEIKEKKNLDRQSLEAHRAKSRQRGEPEEESPSENDGGDCNRTVQFIRIQVN